MSESFNYSKEWTKASKKIEKLYPSMPIIKCLPRIDLPDSMTFWCPFCKTWHTHGRGDGHRVAHCGSSEISPFFNQGYIIKMMSKKELKKIRSAINKHLKDESLE